MTTESKIYFTNFLYGWGSYGLRLISLMILIEKLRLSLYPIVMLWSCLAFILSFTWEKYKKSSSLSPNSRLIFHSLLGISLILLFGNNSHSIEIFLFVITQLILSYLETDIKIINNTNLSILESPNKNSLTVLLENLGLIFASGFIIILEKSNFLNLKPLILITPFFLLIPFSLIVKKKTYLTIKNKSNEIKKNHSPKKEFQISEQLTFIFIPLFFILLAFAMTKSFHQFSLFWSFNEIKNSQSIIKAFSLFSIIQSGLIISSLSFQSFLKRTSSWPSSFKKYYILQLISFSSNIILPNPITYITTSMLRKSFQKTILSPGLNLLSASLPRKALEKQWLQIDISTKAISFLALSFFSFLLIHHQIHLIIFWSIPFICIILSLGALKKLKSRLNYFNLSRILNSQNPIETANCIYSLGYRENKSHSLILLNLLLKEKKPLVIKALLDSLGRMGDKKITDKVLNFYSLSMREDIQLTTLNTILQFHSHKINHFLLSVLKEMIENQKNLGEMRSEIVLNITRKLNLIAIPTIMTIFEQHKNKTCDDSQRILSNAVSILGEFARWRSDVDLFDFISEFISEKYSRRIRTNATFCLYYSKKFKNLALTSLDMLMISSDDHDKSAAAYLIGSLNLKELEGFVIDLNEIQGSKNSTTVISLLKTQYFKSHNIACDFIIKENENEKIKFINQFAAINSQKIRYQFYHFFLVNYPDQAQYLINLLIKSQRNFEKDLQAIFLDCQNLQINTDNLKFIENDDFSDHNNNYSQIA